MLKRVNYGTVGHSFVQLNVAMFVRIQARLDLRLTAIKR